MVRKSRKQNRSQTTETRAENPERAGDLIVKTETIGRDQSELDVPFEPASQSTRFTDELKSDATSQLAPSEHHVLEAVEENANLIRQLMDQLAELSTTDLQANLPRECAGPTDDAFSVNTDEVLAELNVAADQITSLRDRNEELHAELSRCHSSIADLETQNKDLAKQIADSSVRQTVATTRSGAADAMSWEERRELIIAQMEADSFDADQFVEDLGGESLKPKGQGEDPPQSPLEYVNELAERLASAENHLVEREGEVHELRMLLQNQSETREGGMAIGAAAIAQMVDSDELIVAERERLQELQAQWEEKFRQSEIDASLERAKLSRERQELGKRAAELEEQIAHMQRDARETEELGVGTSRRWLAKLGISEES